MIFRMMEKRGNKYSDSVSTVYFKIFRIMDKRNISDMTPSTAIISLEVT